MRYIFPLNDRLLRHYRTRGKIVVERKKTGGGEKIRRDFTKETKRYITIYSLVTYSNTCVYVWIIILLLTCRIYVEAIMDHGCEGSFGVVAMDCERIMLKCVWMRVAERERECVCEGEMREWIETFFASLRKNSDPPRMYFERKACSVCHLAFMLSYLRFRTSFACNTVIKEKRMSRSLFLFVLYPF